MCALALALALAKKKRSQTYHLAIQANVSSRVCCACELRAARYLADWLAGQTHYSNTRCDSLTAQRWTKLLTHCRIYG